MATKKERLKVLEQWSEYFPELTPWEDQWLVQLNGGILSGVCLDRTSSKNFYQPMFFMHNLLREREDITLSYNAPLHNKKGGVGISLSYNRFNENDIKIMKEQIRGLRESISFELFFDHIEKTYKREYHSTPAYEPHLLKDIILIGSYIGDKEFFMNKIEKSYNLLRKYEESLSLRNIDNWDEKVHKLLEQDGKTIIKSEIEKHNLPELEDKGMAYKRIDNYLEKIEDYLKLFYAKRLESHSPIVEKNKGFLKSLL